MLSVVVFIPWNYTIAHNHVTPHVFNIRILDYENEM